jgi:hypothetical protein
MTSSSIPTVPRGAPVFVFRGVDGPSAAALRSAHLAAHLEFVEENFTRFALAGPILDTNGAMIGSLLIVHAESLEGAWTLIRGEPYVMAGVYAVLEADTVRLAAGTLMGGRIWDDAFKAGLKAVSPGTTT